MKVYLNVFASLSDIKAATQKGLDAAFGCEEAEQVRFNLANALRAMADGLDESNPMRTLSMSAKNGEKTCNVKGRKTIDVAPEVVLQKVDRRAAAAARRPEDRSEQTEEQAISALLGELNG